jgi:hypothetical protein
MNQRPPQSLFSRLMTLLGRNSSQAPGVVLEGSSEPQSPDSGGESLESAIPVPAGENATSTVPLSESPVVEAPPALVEPTLVETLPPVACRAEGEADQSLELAASPEADTPAEEALVVPPTLEKTVAPLDREAEWQLKEIRKYSSWDRVEGRKNLDQIIEVFERSYPGHGGAIREAVADGVEDRCLLEEAYNVAQFHGEGAPRLRVLKTNARMRGLSWPFSKKVQKGNQRFASRQAEKESLQKGVPLSNLKVRDFKALPTVFPASAASSRVALSPAPEGLHPSDIRGKRPASKWRVYIDETGSEFGEAAEDARGPARGRVVGIVVQNPCPSLAPLALDWHASERSRAEIERALQALLDSDAGIFGITISAVPMSHGERWEDAVALLIDWILRLLPLSAEEAAEVEVFVEHRGAFKAGDSWELLTRESLRRLALAFPMRAALLDLKVRIIGKKHDGLNPYADAMAFVWAGGTETSRQHLANSKLVGTCLLEQHARDLLHAWDAFSQGVELPAQRWWELVASPDARIRSSILHTFLERVGGECRVLPQNWVRFLNHVRGQMAAGPVDLKKLGAAVAWLQDHQPENEEVPPVLRMSWLTVQIAESNHLGQAEVEWEKELAGLSEGLLEEAAPMVCHANLHLAVAKTNRYAFSDARQGLQRWLEVPPVVPGLQMWAQVRSSLGQHAAFLGEGGRAVGLFREAIQGFERLSDPQQRRKELEQTGCYLALAMMDDPAVSDVEVREAVERVAGPLASAAWSLGGAGDGTLRYVHHLFVRWLVRRGDPELAAVYCEMRPEWKTGEGHPWPLIQLYRAILIHRTHPEAASELVLEAARLANEARQGPVVRLIGACCRAVGRTWGVEWTTAEPEIAALRKALPHAGAHIDCLEQDWSRDPGAVISLLERVLPFNFH